MTSGEPISVMRGQWGPFPGVRSGAVATYEFEIVEPHYVRPGISRMQRVYLLLDQGIQLNQPIVFKPHQAGWWYIDLVEIGSSTPGQITVTDHFLDVIVGPPGHPYRVLDIDELGDAIEAGRITLDKAIAGMRNFQRFLDQHLNRRTEVEVEWPDFPPAALAPVWEAPIPPLR